MNRPPQPPGCNHNRKPRRPRPIPFAQILPSAILRSHIYRECDASRQKATAIPDGLALTGHRKPDPSGRVQDIRASKSP